MKSWIKVLFSALAAAALLAFAAGGALADQLEVSEREFDISWRELTFDGNAGNNVVCPVTLLGTFHSRTLNKVARALVGVIDHARLGPGTTANCTGGSATVLTETLPWHVTYESFTGILPNITGIRLLLIGASFRVNNGTATCLFRTDNEDPASGRAEVSAEKQVTALTADSSRIIDSIDGGFVCGLANGRFTGTGGVENRHGGLLYVRLI